VGFLSWSADVSVVERALGYGPHTVMLSFGDPRPLVEPVLDAGMLLIVQVTDRDETEQALELGAQVLVARARRPAVTAAVAPPCRSRRSSPTLPGRHRCSRPAGSRDERGLGAALVLGAAGALIGTRFQATIEALVAPEVAKAIDGHGEDTVRSRVLDIARGAPWPLRYTARTLRNAFLDRWRGREAELMRTRTPKPTSGRQPTEGTCRLSPCGAGEAIDLIADLAPAADVVASLATDAEAARLHAAPTLR
jgi:nitronate monooxygenase